MTENQIDCRGLLCPEPIMRLYAAIRDASLGDVVEITADDLAFRADLYAWADLTGNEVVEYEPGSVQRALVRKASS